MRSVAVLNFACRDPAKLPVLAYQTGTEWVESNGAAIA
jgi:hypothetical protein